MSFNEFPQISISFNKYQKLNMNIDKVFNFAKLLVVNPPCAYLMVGTGHFYSNGKK